MWISKDLTRSSPDSLAAASRLDRPCRSPRSLHSRLRSKRQKAPGTPLILAVNRASAGDVFFNRRIAGIGNFSRAGNGDFQRLSNCDFRVACACCGDFGGLGLESACLQLASPGHIGKEFIDVSIE
jgi:hypothetical protein